MKPLEKYRLITKFNVLIPRNNRNSYIRGFFSGVRFALLQTNFNVHLHCRVDNLMPPLPLILLAFCTYITIDHGVFIVGRKNLYMEADEKVLTFS